MAQAGLPSLSATNSPAFQTPAPLSGDTVSAIVGFGPSKWGVFDSNMNPIFVTNSFISLEFKRNWHISDYPVEQGGFNAYNKVTAPYEARVTFATGSTGPSGKQSRATLLQSLESTTGPAFNTQLYSIVTPEITYANSANIQSFRYHRKAERGAFLIMVEIDFIEIRQVAALAYSNTMAPSSAGQVNNGATLPQPATQAQLSAWTAALPPIQFSS